jgi:hypothetical protein
MRPPNITTIGIFQESDQGAVTTDLADPNVFGGIGRGINAYVHVDDTTLAFGNSALSPASLAYLGQFLTSMANNGAASFYLNIGLEPTAGYDYVSTQSGQTICGRLAADITALQTTATNNGGQLTVTVRYASEMNLGSYPVANGEDPHAAYSSTFRNVAGILKNANQNIQMAFSPAINFQITDTTFPLFWPGADVVDVISCTWYINGATIGTTPSTAITNLQDYFLHRVGANKIFGIDEMGAWDPVNQSNDNFLSLMFNGIGQLNGHVQLAYTTVFLDNAPGGAQYNHNPVTLGL